MGPQAGGGGEREEPRGESESGESRRRVEAVEDRRPGVEEEEEDLQVQGLRGRRESQGLAQERPSLDQEQVLRDRPWLLTHSDGPDSATSAPTVDPRSE